MRSIGIRFGSVDATLSQHPPNSTQTVASFDQEGAGGAGVAGEIKARAASS